MKTFLNFFYISAVLFSAESCSSKKKASEKYLILPFICCNYTPPVFESSPTLIIQSGFENNTSIYNVSDNILGFQGTDQNFSSSNDWTKANADSSIGDFYLQLGSPGTTSDRKAYITADPVNPANRALSFQIKNATEPDPLKGRASMNIGENLKLAEIYYKVKMFLPPDFGYLKDYTFTSGNWLTLMEFWHSPDWTGNSAYPFRITLYVIKSTDGQNLNFGVEAQSMDPNNWQTVWSMANTGFALPFNEWMQMEAYYREGNKTQGRFYLSVTRSSGIKTVLFDVTNFTHHPMNMNPAGLKWINPMKLYCSKSAVDWVSSHQPTNGTLQVYWDDFEFWKYKKPQ